MADGQSVNLRANLGNGTTRDCWSESNYHSLSFTTAPEACHSEVIENDDCYGAILLPLNKICQQQIFSSVGARWSSDASEYFHCGSSGYRPNDVWFKVQVPESGQMAIESPLLFNDNNMILEAYRGNCDQLELISCDQFGSNNGSIIRLQEQIIGSFIYIRVADQGNNSQGDFAICVYDDANVSLLSRG